MEVWMPGKMTPPRYSPFLETQDGDDRTPHQLVGGQRVDDAVRADLARVLVAHRHAGADARADHQGGAIEELRADAFEDGQQRRDDGRDDDVADVGNVAFGVVE
jgi:hypothetical protein